MELLNLCDLSLSAIVLISDVDSVEADEIDAAPFFFLSFLLCLPLPLSEIETHVNRF